MNKWPFALATIAFLIFAPFKALSQPAQQQEMALWGGLSSGMTVEQVSATLQARNIRSRPSRNEGGIPGLEIRSAVDAAGRRASLSVSFQRRGLFWVEIEYSLPSFESLPDHFNELTGSLSTPYGSPNILDRYARDVTPPNAAAYGMRVMRQDAAFLKDGLVVDVYTSQFIDPTRGTSEKKVRIRYWRAIDRDDYLEAIERDNNSERVQRDRALREGL